VTYLVGKIALGVVAGAPNNGEGEANLATVKSMRVGREEFPWEKTDKADTLAKQAGLEVVAS
jgi:hypothetical protein